jgi:hypothetical protein
MRTTRNKQTDTPAPCDPSATIHTQATPHTSNQSAPPKLASILLPICLLIAFRPTFAPEEFARPHCLLNYIITNICLKETLS